MTRKRSRGVHFIDACVVAFACVVALALGGLCASMSCDGWSVDGSGACTARLRASYSRVLVLVALDYYTNDSYNVTCYKKGNLEGSSYNSLNLNVEKIQLNKLNSPGRTSAAAENEKLRRQM